jgi:hypothetical protein
MRPYSACRPASGIGRDEIALFASLSIGLMFDVHVAMTMELAIPVLAGPVSEHRQAAV